MLRPVTDHLVRPITRDVVLAWGRLRASPRVAWGSIAAFAIGIAGYTTLFGIVDSMASRASLAVSRSDQVVKVYIRNNGNLQAMSMALFDEFRSRADAFEEVSAFGTGIAQVTVTPKRKRRANVMAVSGGYFDILRAHPMVGRYFSLEDDKQVNGSDVAVVSTDLWATLFDSSPATVGSKIFIGGTTYLVVGIAPPGFPGAGLGSADIWVPVKRAYEFDAGTLGPAPVLWLLGRLRPDVTIAEGEASATKAYRAVVVRLPLAWPPRGEASSDAVLRAVRADFDSRFRGWATAFALSLAMVVAAAVGCLLLLRLSQPRKEAVLRAALGAGSRPIVVVLIWDVGILLGAAAVLAALVVAAGRSMSEDYSLINPLGAGVSVRVLAIVSTVATLVGAFLSIIPALRAADEHPEGPWFTRLFPHEPDDVPIVDWTAGLSMERDDRDGKSKSSVRELAGAAIDHAVGSR